MIKVSEPNMKPNWKQYVTYVILISSAAERLMTTEQLKI